MAHIQNGQWAAAGHHHRQMQPWIRYHLWLWGPSPICQRRDRYQEIWYQRWQPCGVCHTMRPVLKGIWMWMLCLWWVLQCQLSSELVAHFIYPIRISSARCANTATNIQTRTASTEKDHWDHQDVWWCSCSTHFSCLLHLSLLSSGPWSLCIYQVTGTGSHLAWCQPHPTTSQASHTTFCTKLGTIITC